MDKQVTRKHYTKTVFACALVRWVPTEPASVLDPAAGEGALLLAARSRWPEARLFGFDISRSAIRRASANLPGATLTRADATISPWTTKSHEAHSLVLCNPPFRGESLQSVAQRLDLRFLDLALNAVEPGGYVLFVLPASVAAYPSFSEVRRSWIKRSQIIAAVSLPENAFENTEANAVALLMRPGMPDRRRLVTFAALARNGRVVQRVRAPLSRRSWRLDPSFYIRQRWIPKVRCETRPLYDVLKDVRRGTFVSRPERRRQGPGLRFIHSTDLSAGWISDGSLAFVNSGTKANIDRGCVLLSRVGEGLWQKSALYIATDEAVGSDCVYIMRAASQWESRYLATVLTTRFVQASIRQLVRGITAPLLNKRELLELRIPWLSLGERRRIAAAWLRATSRNARRAITAELNNRLERRSP